MKRFFLGIDPGQKGGLALLDRDGRLVAQEGSPGLVENYHEALWDIRATAETEGPVEIVAGLEVVHGRAPFGATGSFKLGESFGGWRASLAALGWPLHLVKVHEWQKVIDTTKPKSRTKEKNGSKAIKKWVAEYAARVWPDGQFHGPRGGLLDGLADAAVIAEYTRRMLLGGQ